MNKIALIASIDYELFGDGSGNVEREQILPTNELLKIANTYGVKLTIMFEYAQYLAYEKFGKDNFKLLEDNKKIREQLIEFIKQGHDVQLHYHAQWEQAEYEQETKQFRVDLDTVDISSLEYERIVEILSRGKLFLENLLKPYRGSYKCIGFRAGSWSVNNEKKLTKALKETGFKSDTSVVPNVKFESEQVNFEYKNCPSQYHYWYVDDVLTQKVKISQFVEIPIYTEKDLFGFLKYLNTKYLESRKIVSQFYKVKISERNFSVYQKLKKVMTRNYYMADLNTMCSSTLIEMVEKALQDEKFQEDNTIIPLMFISHSKTSYALSDLHHFFTYLKKHYPENVMFWSYQEAIEYLVEEDHEVN